MVPLLHSTLFYLPILFPPDAFACASVALLDIQSHLADT